MQTYSKNANPIGQFFKSFVEHPASVGETFVEHFLFALKFSLLLFCAAMAAFIHAFIPALFEKTASQIIRNMVAKMDARTTD